MLTTPKVSVVMSVYNGAEYLKDAIDSILGQSFKDFEFIIINDASVDGTDEVVRKYNDPRIVYVCNKSNLGLTTNLNKGLDLAKGEYVARQDDDDISLPDRLAKQVRFLDANPDIVLVGSFVNLVDGDGKTFSSWRMPTEDKDIKKELELGSAFCHGSVLFRREQIQREGGYREKAKYVEDYDLWLRLADKYKLANINVPLYSLRRAIASISTKNIDKQICNHLLVRQLSFERRGRGTDSLDELDQNNVLESLIQKYHLTMRDINLFKARYMEQYYLQAVQTEKIADLLKFGGLIFRANPNVKFCLGMMRNVFRILRKRLSV